MSDIPCDGLREWESLREPARLFDCPACKEEVLVVDFDTTTAPPTVTVGPCGHEVTGWWHDTVVGEGEAG